MKATGLPFEIEPTPVDGGRTADAARLAAARAVRLSPDFEEAFAAHGPAAQSNLERLFGGALCVTTGQQPGLLTGPLYTIHKALTAVALAGEASRRLGEPVVPVFWVAGDDHDFAEANEAYVLGRANEIVRLVLRERDPAAPLTPLYREPVGAEVGALLAALREALPETEFVAGVLEWLERHYRPEADLASAFGHALAELLGPLGLVVFAPTHPAVKRAMAPWIRRLLEAAEPLHQALVAQAGELEEAGRPVRVNVGEPATLVMIEGRLGRDRLLLDKTAYVARRSGERWSPAELSQLLERQPERFSPNVLARPAIEAALLPTIAYVGGPAELSYWLQAEPVYRTLGVAAQAGVPRWSGRVIEARVGKVLSKYAIAPEALAQAEGQLEATLVGEALPPAAREALAALRMALTGEYDRLIAAAVAVDPTLRKPVESAKHAALGNVQEIEKRLVSHLKKQNAIVLQQVDKARRNLFPLGRPQERVLNVTSYLARYGEAFLDAVLAACQRHVASLETILPPA